MADSRTVTVIPLNGSNFLTWKVQCRMALMREGLWNIVNGSKHPPDSTQAGIQAKFAARRDCAFAIILLFVEPLLLYLFGDPEDPIAVWRKLAYQSQKKTWANKLELQCKLHCLLLCIC